MIANQNLILAATVSITETAGSFGHGHAKVATNPTSDYDSYVRLTVSEKVDRFTALSEQEHYEAVLTRPFFGISQNGKKPIWAGEQAD